MPVFSLRFRSNRILTQPRKGFLSLNQQKNMQSDFPQEIYMRYECHVVKYFLNDREMPTQVRYYDLDQVLESHHIHFENKIYFQDKVPVTTTVFKDRIKALEAAHHYAKSKMHNIEKELDKLYKK